MGRATVTALRIVLALVLAGTLFVQLVMIPMILLNSSPGTGTERIVESSFLAYLFLAGLIIETCVYCVWKLATRVARGTVFDSASNKFVAPIIISIGCGAVATFAFAAILASSTEIAPGVVLLFGGVGVLLVGVGVIVLVLRQLLIQATTTQSQAEDLRAELGTVI